MNLKHILATGTLTWACILCSACHSSPSTPLDTATKIALSDEVITVDGEEISNDTAAAVYTANDIIFYQDGQDFTYGEGTQEDEHSQEEAAAHTVVHITQPGTYALSGSLSAGQIAIDLGEDAKEDPNAVVTLILNNVEIHCSVAPGVIFYNVYECGSADTETASETVDTTAAGANVIIADDTTNIVDGSYVARIYKSYTLNEDGTEVTDNEKLHKYDGAFYSKCSMNVTGGTKGNGILNITAANEGLDSELHLTINGGVINITAGNDGINTNEDGVSVTTINDGTVNIIVDGATGEGDGIDSNGWLVINGGTVTAQACSTSGDSGLDSDMGISINGGTVIATGNMLDRLEEDGQTYAVFAFPTAQTEGITYTLKNKEEKSLFEFTTDNTFTYLVLSSPSLTEGDYTLWKDGTQLAGATSATNTFMQGPALGDMQMPENEEAPELPEGMEKPDGAKQPEGMEQPDDSEPPEGLEKPDGLEPPEGMEKPDGTKQPKDMEQPDGSELPEGMDITNIETSTTFTLEAGSNFFQIILASD